jgi:hypothetical protein
MAPSWYRMPVRRRRRHAQGCHGPVGQASLWPFLVVVWGLAFLYAQWRGWL